MKIIVRWGILIFVGLLLQFTLASCSGGDSGSGGNAASPNEGSISAPVTLVPETSHNGKVGGMGTSYYQFNTGAANAVYKISLTKGQSDIAWELYSDSGFTTQISGCDFQWNLDEICSTPTLSANTTYYMTVVEWDNTAGTFTVDVNWIADATGIVNAGSIANPVPLNVGITLPTRIQAYGISFYSFTTGSTAATYTIGVTSTQSNLGWVLFTDPDFVMQTEMCDFPWTQNEICTTLNSLNPNTVYYLFVHEWDGVAGTFNLLVQ